MEVHGQYEEYLQTIKGELLDEVEGSSLYKTRIDLKRLQSELLLKVPYTKCLYHDSKANIGVLFSFKFCKIQDKTALWVYGISAVTKVISGPLNKLSAGQTSSIPGNASLNSLLSSLMPALPGMSQSSAKPFGNIETLIDNKVKEMEERIVHRIEERFNCLEKKIDENNEKILALLMDLKK